MPVRRAGTGVPRCYNCGDPVAAPGQLCQKCRDASERLEEDLRKKVSGVPDR